jgi:Ca-activated chloride channel family protein
VSVGFANPWALFLLLPIPVVVWWLRRSRTGGLRHARADSAGVESGRLLRVLGAGPDALRVALALLLVVVAAGPRTGSSVTDINAEGIAIVLTIDVSSSMLAEDFAPRNRISVAKEKVADFVRGRRYDRIGLVAFAGEALTQVPITVDYPILFQALDRLQAGTQQLQDGTAIGTALATAANRLRAVPGTSKVIILMTDGENNRGEIDPVTAAQAAAAFDMKVYTIGVGSESVAPIPVATTPFGLQYATLPVHIDEDLLREIASTTGGQYFRATNEEALDSIYSQIDRLEKATVQVRRYVDYTSRFMPFLVLAMVTLLAEWAIRASRWGAVP